MEYLGFIAFILLLFYSSYPGKTKKLEKELKILKRNMKGRKGMSKLINDLKGKRCLIKSGETFLAMGSTTMECDVIDVDNEWIKISFKEKRTL